LAFNSATIEGLVCRNMISIGWGGIELWRRDCVGGIDLFEGDAE
jgi:hypothetical protein